MKFCRRWNISVFFVLKPRMVCAKSVKGQMGCYGSPYFLLSRPGQGPLQCFPMWWLVDSLDGWVGGPKVLARNALIVKQTIWGPLRLWRQIASPRLQHLTIKPFSHHTYTPKMFGFWKMSSQSGWVERFQEMIISGKWWDGKGWQITSRGCDKFPACLVQVLDKWARQLN